jgi:hypothetical protein
MREFEKAVGTDAGLLRETLAVDRERRAVQQLVGVIDAARPKALHVIV